MISKFFIERPRFAFVIAILISLAGLIALGVMPVTQYPNITPSQVAVSATYPGADALTLQQTVVEPLEAQINGVKRMLYMSSTSSDSGSATITVTLGIGTDGDSNTVNVQNRANWALSQLPEEVQRQGVIVKEKSSNMLLVMTLYSPKGTYDALFLTNYALLNIKDELSRVNGVGDIGLLGNLNYAMRIWLDPDRMASLGLDVNDISSAIKAQNVQVSSGALGEAPTPADQIFRFSIQTQGRLTSVEEFENIVIRALDDGAQVKLKDVAKVELGAETYTSSGLLNDAPAALLAIYQLNDANGLAIAEACKAKLAELAESFPDDLEYGFQYDTTKFIDASISEVERTLFEAVILVVLVTFIFLQNWRMTLVPTIAIPVSLIGTFAVLLSIGYSINLITLFGLILAIGIVVDDAIVVIENVSRLMEEEKLSPKAAALKSMEEVTGPVIATTAVLLAMFVPVCFLSGITGEMYRQFGITISVAVAISAINALTLSPALSAILLKPPSKQPRRKFFAFRWFDAFFDRLTASYGWTVGKLLRAALLVFVIYCALTFLTLRLFNQLPTGFIPGEDQGAFFVNVQLPDNASLERTEAVVKRINDILLAEPGVSDVIASPGFSILTGTNASNNAMMIGVLKDWSERQTPDLYQSAIVSRVQKKLSAIPEAVIQAFDIPTIPGIGVTGGFSFVVEDTTGTDPARMMEALDQLIAEANQDPTLTQVYTTYRAALRQVYLEIDREKALKMGVSLDSINNALQGLMGYAYVNDFNKFGKVYKVEIQSQADSRAVTSDINRLYVRNSGGEMVPLNTLVMVKTRYAPQYLTRYNMYSSATVQGMPRPGVSSGTAMAAMEAVAKRTLPAGMRYEWTDMSYQEKAAEGQIGIVFALALLFIYLFLVAQYESWMIPFGVILSVPIALFGAVLFLMLRNIDNNIYTQVGLVLLCGIACKTAILIVEFAKVKHEEGMPILEAAAFAAKLRFRAVLMTAISFILGTLPLVVATGPGANSRQALGTAVVGGMFMAVVIGTFLIPAFYVIVQQAIELVKRKAEK